MLYLLEIEVRPLGLIFILNHYHCCPLCLEVYYSNHLQHYVFHCKRLKFSDACIIPKSQPPDPDDRERMFNDNLGMRARILNFHGSKFSCFTYKYFQGINFPNLSFKYCSDPLIGSLSGMQLFSLLYLSLP